MGKPKWSDAVREQREGPAPEPKVKEKPGRCDCGDGRFKLRVDKSEWTRTCKGCGEEQEV